MQILLHPAVIARRLTDCDLGTRIDTLVAHATCKCKQLCGFGLSPNECTRPAHAYTYSFEPNPNWSSFYAYAPEIRQYFEGFAQKHGLMPNIKLNSRILSATWAEEKGICELFFLVYIKIC
jgi:hypothetical protein